MALLVIGHNFLLEHNTLHLLPQHLNPAIYYVQRFISVHDATSCTVAVCRNNAHGTIDHNQYDRICVCSSFRTVGGDSGLGFVVDRRCHIGIQLRLAAISYYVYS